MPQASVAEALTLAKKPKSALPDRPVAYPACRPHERKNCTTFNFEGCVLSNHEGSGCTRLDARERAAPLVLASCGGVPRSGRSSASCARFHSQEAAAMRFSPSADPGLFRRGVHFLYGKLFRAMFEFRAPRHGKALHLQSCEWGSAAQAQGVRVSVHLRHQSTAMLGSEYLPAVLAAVQALVRGRRCTVLLASDRRASYSVYSAALVRIGCETMGNPRPSERRVRTYFAEHGPDDGPTALSDLELLSHGHHLVGHFGAPSHGRWRAPLRARHAPPCDP